MFLTAGEFSNIFIEPGLNSEKGCHLRYPATNGGRIIAKAFQSKGQFVPHLVRNDLIFRALLNKADALALLPLA